MTMKPIALATMLLALTASLAEAANVMTSPSVQTSPNGSPSVPTMPMIASATVTNPHAPVSGSNSFTSTQVRARLTEAGYSNIGKLRKNNNGVWYGNATQNGVTKVVYFDYQGNITSKAR
jgi:hypothetical protein